VRSRSGKPDQGVMGEATLYLAETALGTPKKIIEHAS
jgi:hypothetical protein